MSGELKVECPSFGRRGAWSTHTCVGFYLRRAAKLATLDDRTSGCFQFHPLLDEHSSGLGRFNVVFQESRWSSLPLAALQLATSVKSDNCASSFRSFPTTRANFHTVVF